MDAPAERGDTSGICRTSTCTALGRPGDRRVFRGYAAGTRAPGGAEVDAQRRTLGARRSGGGRSGLLRSRAVRALEAGHAHGSTELHRGTAACQLEWRPGAAVLLGWTVGGFDHRPLAVPRFESDWPFLVVQVPGFEG